MSAPVLVKQFPLDKEYAKKTGVTPEDIAKLRAWLATQPHLPGNILTDLDLVLVYHCCQRSAEVSKQVLDLNLTLKTHFTNLFKDRLVTPKTIATLSMCTMTPLEVRARDESAVMYLSLIDADANKFICHQCLRVALMILDLWQEEEGTWPGLQMVFDFRMFSLKHLAKLDLPTIQQFLYYLQEGMLVKVTGLHFMNAPPFMNKVMMLINPFLKKEIKECLFIHQVGTTTLEKHLPMEGLPVEAGGKYMSTIKASERMKERLELNKNFFERENKKRVIEAKRPGRPKTISDMFGGVEGSFKKLDID